MAIILPSGFNITNSEPVDARFALANQSARYALSAANIYKGLVVFQQDDSTLFVLTDTTNVGNPNGWTQIQIGAVTSNLPSGVISSSQQVIDIFNANFTAGSTMATTVDTTFATDQELYVTSSNLDAGEF
jgi:hypothetical protein